jgi:hypothetical protein
MMKRCIFLPLLCAGDYRKMVENAICALSMAMVLGEAVPTCYLFSQLALAHVALQEFRKAEAYARMAIDVAEGGCSMHQLMSVENPLAPPPPGTYVATQFESAAADARLWLSIGKTIRSFAISRSIMYICNLDLHLTTAYALHTEQATGTGGLQFQGCHTRGLRTRSRRNATWPHKHI